MTILIEDLIWLIIILIVAFLFTLWIFSKSFGPWVGTEKGDRKRILALTGLQPGQVFYDLGCGSGKMVIWAHLKLKVKAVGIERNTWLYLLCLLHRWYHSSEAVVFKRADYFKENLSEADVVYFFDLPTSLNHARLAEKLKQELKPGSRVISYSYSFPEWEPILVDRPHEESQPIFVYQL